MLLACLLVAGCSSELYEHYTDESQILRYESIEAMGIANPRIIVDGQKLEYDADVKWYFYKGTRIPALWAEFGGDETTVPERVLYITGRVLPNGEYEQYQDGKWVKVKKNEQPTVEDFLDGKESFRK